MTLLEGHQLETLTSYMRLGTLDASRALTTWLGHEVSVRVEQLAQVDLTLATEQLGQADQIVCACCMRVNGGIGCQMILGFDDASGRKLCESLLSRETRFEEWNELERSSVLETTNIVGCALLHSLSIHFQAIHSPHDMDREGADFTWDPMPPVFVRDYAASIMQFVLLDQRDFDTVLFAQMNFAIDDMPVGWRLLLIPDAMVLDRLKRTLA